MHPNTRFTDEISMRVFDFNVVNSHGQWTFALIPINSIWIAPFALTEAKELSMFTMFFGRLF